MPALLLGSLLLQACAAGLVLWRLKGQVIQHLGAVFLLSAVAYHGLGELIQRMFHSSRGFREYLTIREVDNWLWLASIATLVFAVVYVAALGKPAARAATEATRRRTVEVLDVRLLLLLTLPLLVATASGRGFAVDVTSQGTQSSFYWAAGLSSQFLLTLLALSAALIVLRGGGRHLGVVFVVLVATGSLVGQRFFPVYAALMAAYALARHGIHPTRRQIGLGLMLTVALALVISASRSQGPAEIGKNRYAFAQSSGTTNRVQALVKGTAGLVGGSGWSGLSGDYVYRLDGNAEPAMILGAIDSAKPVGTTTLMNDLHLVSPSFIDHNKLNRPEVDRNEKDYFKARYNLDLRRDYITTQFGALLSYAGPFGLLPLVALAAALFAGLDRWLNAGEGPIRLVLGMGLLEAVLLYESTPMEYFIILRGTALLLFLVAALAAVRRVARRSATRVRKGQLIASYTGS